MLTQVKPADHSRFSTWQLEPTIELDYPKGSVVMSGTKTQVSLEHRKTGENVVLNIYSREPLRPHQLREAITQATGDHWDYKQLSLAAFPYEF